MSRRGGGGGATSGGTEADIIGVSGLLGSSSLGKNGVVVGGVLADGCPDCGGATTCGVGNASGVVFITLVYCSDAYCSTCSLIISAILFNTRSSTVVPGPNSSSVLPRKYFIPTVSGLTSSGVGSCVTAVGLNDVMLTICPLGAACVWDSNRLCVSVGVGGIGEKVVPSSPAMPPVATLVGSLSIVILVSLLAY